MKPVKFAFASALLAVATTIPAVRARQSPSVGEIFKRMSKTYETCRTYRDEGTFKSWDKRFNAKRFYDVGTFKTARVQPDKCRVAVFLKKGKTVPFVVWRKGKKSRFWNGAKRTDEAKDFYTALNGIRAGHVSYTQLLFPPLTKIHLDYIVKNFVRIADAKTDGEDCYRMRFARKSKGDKFVNIMYISKTTFLLHKMEYNSEFKLANFRVVKTYSETRWHPVINEEIPDSALEYNPPR